MISDQDVRDQVIHDHDTLFAVDAGAGTGKTTLLVSRLIALLLEKQAPLSRIAAIWAHWTFRDPYGNMTIYYGHRRNP